MLSPKSLFLTLLLAASAPAAAQQTGVNFKTSDGCLIAAYYLPPSPGSYILINAHGLGSSKNEWAPFQEQLKRSGCGYLSLDLRGHNASKVCAGRPVDYRTFSRTDWNLASRDIEAAAAWLLKKGYPAGRIVFCGASIGANLSLKAAAQGALKPAAVVLLSPGLEYAGVNIENYFSAPRSWRILTAAAANDPYAFRSSVLLTKAARERNRQADFLDGAGGHGVNMLTNAGVMTRIISWIKEKDGRTGSKP